jgi:competence protein ComGC
LKNKNNLGFGLVEYIIVFVVLVILLSVFHDEIVMWLSNLFSQITEF